MNMNFKSVFMLFVVFFFTRSVFSQDTAPVSHEKVGKNDDLKNKKNEYVIFSFDDVCIPWKHNLKLTMVEATKYPGNPVLRKGPKGTIDDGHAILYGTVIKTGNKYRMWYLAKHGNTEEKGQVTANWRPMCYAESNDGINWVKPNLDLVEFNGTKQNNICLVEGDPYSLTRINDFLTVLYEPEETDPSRKYKAVYIAHVPYQDIRGGLSNIGVREKTPCVIVTATSSDGLRWKVLGDAPVSAGGERFEATSIYRFGNYYYSTGQLLSPWAWLPNGDPVGRIMQVYRSRDFKNWSHAKADGFIRVGQLTKPAMSGQQIHMGAGLWNRGNVMVGLYGMWKDGPKEKPEGAGRLWGTNVDLGLIISNDGIHYREPVTDFKAISRGKSGEWDDIALLQGHAFVNEGDKTMIWYSHWDTGGQLKSMEIGLATLRRDGFGFLERNYKNNDAHFITSSIKAKKRTKLLINVDGVTPDAPLTIELIDEKSGLPIKGYSGKKTAIVKNNGVRTEVVWGTSESSFLPVNRPFEIKVNFPDNCNAKLYSLYVVN